MGQSEDISKRVETFLHGRDPLERIVSIECGYRDERVTVYYRNENGARCSRQEPFLPFVYAKVSVCRQMCGGNQTELKQLLKSYGIRCSGTRITDENGKTHERLENGYRIRFQATKMMSWSRFQSFFTKTGFPIYDDKRKRKKEKSPYFAVSPVEQYMVYSGRRFFKGYENYDDVRRLVFDLETEGLDPERHRINQIGVRTNKGFTRIITIPIEGDSDTRDMYELSGICEFITEIARQDCDVLAGHNSANFDWPFLIRRCEIIGKKFALSGRGDGRIVRYEGEIPLDGSLVKITFENLTKMILGSQIRKSKRESILKLGGEVEVFLPTEYYGHIILDSMHAVRRAQAQDSDFKESGLKYATKKLKLAKPNRVYLPGDRIRETWEDDKPNYALDDTNGFWTKFTDSEGNESGGWRIGKKDPNKVGKKNEDGTWRICERVTGRYIAERYLGDDLYETDKVECAMNESNFLIGKMIPTTFKRACTMGTAGIWKLIMLAWSYENGLGIPEFAEKRKFTGGLSRLLCVGFIGEQVKLDFNSLYPSIMLTWGIESCVDISHAITHLLEYVLTMREHYKGLKKKHGKLAENAEKELERQLESLDKAIDAINELKAEISKNKSLKSLNDKLQLPLKILGNSVFGSFGAAVFPWSDMDAAENVTCIGRQCLRLLVSWFGQWGYRPIVGDSFTGDTPIFIRYANGEINIIPISEAIDEKRIKTDFLGREYDFSRKDFEVLCRSGWVSPSYIYRHKTDKDMYEVSDVEGKVTVTEDHSLFNSGKRKIKPSEIDGNTEIEHYDIASMKFQRNTLSPKCGCKTARSMGRMIAIGKIERVPVMILNGSVSVMESFIEGFSDAEKEIGEVTLSQTGYAGVSFLKKIIS